MASTISIETSASADLLHQLGSLCQGRGLDLLAHRLADLHTWIGSALHGFESELKGVRRGERVVQRSAHHLLDLGGKHLRPMCVALAAKLGDGFDDKARQLAVAVELVHSATLLHDDVVDLGDTRRGAPAARMVYGNAASIFAGDWLLVEALRRIRLAGGTELLDRMLAVIDQMILAESVQLENRGRINANVDDYFYVVEGKTAALFRWAMFAGGHAGGLDLGDCAALERFGNDLGVAFQAIDDLLDVDGEPVKTGKALFTDLREGKITYPLLVALDREPALAAVLEDVIADDRQEVVELALAAVVASVKRTGALETCRNLAHDRAQRAIHNLDALADGPGKNALVTVAEATIHRER